MASKVANNLIRSNGSCSDDQLLGMLLFQIKLWITYVGLYEKKRFQAINYKVLKFKYIKILTFKNIKYENLGIGFNAFSFEMSLLWKWSNWLRANRFRA